jgi:hypothetical protein
MFNKDFVTKEEQERRRNAGVGVIKSAVTITMPATYWAVLQQLQTELGKKNASETMMYCILEIATEKGIES